jgi:Flp pilus assembly protein TadD
MPDRFWSSDEYDERAHLLYNEGDYDGALETLKEGLALYPTAVELYVGMGYARLAREEYAWARRAFERALLLDAAHEDAMVGLGEVLLRLGHRSEALRHFDAVRKAGYEDDVELMLTMGRALYREGLFARALDVFTRLAALRPDSAEALASVGYALHRMGDDVGASRHLRRALRMNPSLHEARTYLGHLLYDRGNWEGALREFERVPPAEHWDPLAVWRMIELKRSIFRVGEEDPRIVAWQRRLDELETADSDPVDELLAEVEARFGGGSQWPLRDENQLELFHRGDDARGGRGSRIRIRTEEGELLSGSWQEIIRQIRDSAGFSHESLAQFMRRLAERWHEEYGVDVPLTNAESFLRGATRAGIYRLIPESGSDAGPPGPGT